MSPGDNPFSADSIWNRELPADTPFQAAPGVAERVVGLSTWLDSASYSASIPVYQATADSGSVKLLYSEGTWGKLFSGEWKNTGNSAEVEQQILSASGETFPFPFHTYVSQSGTELVLPERYDEITNPEEGARLVRLPEGATPSISADGHMVVWQPDGSVLETFGTIILSDGTIVCQTYKITDGSLSGDGWQNGVTASMIPVHAGLITQADIDSGVIDHAVKIIVPAGLLDPSTVYPALSFDRGALTEDPPYSGDLPMGALLALPPGFDLASLGLMSDLGRMIAQAALKHGFIITDRGGSGITVCLEAGVTDSAARQYDWQVDHDLEAIFEAVQRGLVDDGDYVTSEDVVYERPLSGGTGDDTYDLGHWHPQITDPGGTDTIKSSISRSLADYQGIENLILTGSDDIDGTGNAGHNSLTGNAGINRLAGGRGNDSYQVNDAGDRVIEAVGEGRDTVHASVSYTLLAGQEIEILAAADSAGVSSIRLTGNDFAQRINGNDGDNTLDGRGGADTLYGLGGDDTYRVDVTGDRVFEAVGEGNDKVVTGVNYTLTGGQEIETLTTADRDDTTPIRLTGNEFAQRLYGNDGDNILDGGGGADTLYGYGGRDSFKFSSPPGAGNVVRIGDFDVAEDTIRLDRAIFTALARGALPEDALFIGRSAADAGDRIIYDAASGRLSYDADGHGGAAAVVFATLQAGLALTAADFLVY